MDDLWAGRLYSLSTTQLSPSSLAIGVNIGTFNYAYDTQCVCVPISPILGRDILNKFIIQYRATELAKSGDIPLCGFI